MTTIGQEDISSVKIKFPHPKEQTKIATFLTAVDKRIKLLKKKKDKLEQYKKGVMQKLFSVETHDRTSLRFKDKNGNDFPDWKEKKLGEIATVKGGKRIPKGYTLKNKNNGFPYITVSDMGNNTVSLSEIRYIPFEVVDKIKNYKITKKDIFISVAGTLGVVGIVPVELDNANLTENANKLTDLKCNQNFLLQLLNTNRLTNQIKSVTTIGAQPKLAIYAINNFKFLIPNSLPEQQKIADFLSVIDKSIEKVGGLIKKSQEWKKGLLQKMFV